jgi:hypothetical protein
MNTGSLWVSPIPPGVSRSSQFTQAVSTQDSFQYSRSSSSDWSPAEDLQLTEAVARHGVTDWQKIADLVGRGRTKSQCSQHWFRCLDPAIVKGRWGHDEDIHLLSLVAQFGPRNWAQIAAQMVTRSDVQCRHRYMHLRDRKEAAPHSKCQLPSIETFLKGDRSVLRPPSSL